MDNIVQKELDQLVDVLDKKIEDKFDTIQIDAKKSSFDYS